MPSTVFDSGIFRDAFGAPAMRAVFCDEAMIARYVEVEVALAAAEASVGVIPKDAAEAIKRLARAEAIDVGKLKAETDLVGYPIVGARASARQAMRRGGALPALGRHHPGHHGHRHGAADARRAGARRRRPGGARDRARRARRQAPRHGDGGPHAPAARAAGDLRLQGGRLARHDRAAPRAPGPAAPPRAGRPVRRRGGHAGLARRQGPRRARRADGGARPRPRVHAVARRARRLRGGRVVAGARHRHAGQDRHRRDAADADRGRRGVRAVRAGPRLVLDHAAEAQPHLLRVHRRGRPRSCASTPA